MLGTAPNDPDLPKPNYGLPVEQIYQQFAKYFIMTGQGVKMIERAGLTAASMQLPTCCPDWNGKEIFKRSNDRAFDGADRWPPRIIHQNPAWVTVDGSLIDVITEIGPSLPNGLVRFIHDDYLTWFDGSAKLIEEALTSKYGEDGTILQLWCRLLIGGLTPRDGRVEDFMKYHNRVCEHTHIGPHEDPRTSWVLDLYEKKAKTLGEVYAQGQDGGVWDIFIGNHDALGKEENNGLKFFLGPYHSSNSVKHHGCRVCVTANGFLGLVGEGARSGDFVSILFGISYRKVPHAVEETFQNVENVFILPVLGEDTLEVNMDRSEIILS